MVVWGFYELVRIWNAGWIWGGWPSAIAFFVGLGGLLWLNEDARLLYKRVNEKERRSKKELVLRELALAKLNATKASIESKIKESERQMMAPPLPNDEEGLRRENNLVAAVRWMKPEERFNLIDKDNLDDELAGAILRSHHVAVGMTKNEQDLFRIAWQRQKFPSDVDQLTRLSNALGHIERGIPILNAFAEQKANSLAGGLHASEN